VRADAPATAAGHDSRGAHHTAQRDAHAKVLGYTGRTERRWATRSFPPKCWIYRSVHELGVAVRCTAQFKRGKNDCNITDKVVENGTLVGVVECKRSSDGVTLLKLFNFQHGEGWVFDRSPGDDGKECMELVRKAK
jgi:hypothetical protein